MSYDISYGRAVVCIPESDEQDKPYGYNKQILIPLEIVGCSNLYYYDSNKRVRHLTSFKPVPNEYEIMEHAVRCAIGTAGGSLKVNGRDTTPEGYIKGWRNALKNPVSLKWARQYLWGSLAMELKLSRFDDEMMEKENSTVPSTVYKNEDGDYILKASFRRDNEVDQFRRLCSCGFNLHRCGESDDENSSYAEFIKNWNNPRFRYVD